MLAWPVRGLLIGVVVWKLATEALRPVTGEPIWQFIDRGGSYGTPLALAWLQSWRQIPRERGELRTERSLA